MLADGDLMLLGSDGLFDAFPQPNVEHVVDITLKALVRRQGDLQAAATDVVREAEDSLMCRDNVTCVLVACFESEE